MYTAGILYSRRFVASSARPSPYVPRQRLECGCGITFRSASGYGRVAAPVGLRVRIDMRVACVLCWLLTCLMRTRITRLTLDKATNGGSLLTS